MQPLFRKFGLCAALALTAAHTSAKTLQVGPDQNYTTISAAIAVSRDGDVIDVKAGNYDNDFAELTHKVTLNAVGGWVHLRSTGYVPNRKGILITDTSVTINHFWFSGAKVSDDDGGNGAGIRYQGGNLTLNGCYFVHNQDGILGVGDGTGLITVIMSEFAFNGASTGPSAGYTHNFYMSGIARLTVTDSYFHGAFVGHELKSRATQTIIKNSRFVDGPTGTASYSIDLPNGGNALIMNSQIEQGPQSQNPYIIAFGEEGGILPGSKLVISGSLIENDLTSASATAIWNASAAPAHVSTMRIFGLKQGSLLRGSATVSGITYLAKEPQIATRHPWQ